MNAHKITRKLEMNAKLPNGKDERFKGYGVMGLPFHSNHLLALRRFPKTSVGYHPIPGNFIPYLAAVSTIFFTSGGPSG